MTKEMDIVIRESRPTDASEIISVMKKIGNETSFLVMDEEGLGMPDSLLAMNIEMICASPNNVLLVAVYEEMIIGLASVKAPKESRIEHIGEMGISIVKEYWGLGLGTAMVKELLIWSKESQIIRRLELTVQSRNKRAIQLYRKIGFVREGTMARGVKIGKEEFLDVEMMSLLIDHE